MNEKRVIEEIMASTGISYNKAYRILNPTFYDYLINFKYKMMKFYNLRKKRYENVFLL